jgi:ATP-dependent Lon protease
MASIDSLPLFPLNLVLYPNEKLPLHIFEERYRDLTQYCLDHDVPFGIVRSENDTPAEVGTTARIQRVVNRYEDGRLDIEVRGEERFRLLEIYEEKNYYTADVNLLKDEEEVLAPDLKERAITQHMKLLELAGRTVRPDLYKDVDKLSYVLARNAVLDEEQKQEVLEKSSESERIQYLIRHFETLIPRVEQKEDINRRIRSNGHFKDFPPEEA